MQCPLSVPSVPHRNGAGPSCPFSDYETGGLWCRPGAPLMLLALRVSMRSSSSVESHRIGPGCPMKDMAYADSGMVANREVASHWNSGALRKALFLTALRRNSI